MRSRLLVVGVCALGVVLVGVLALTSRSSLAFTLGVSPGGVAAKLRPGQEACQGPIRIPDADARFRRVAVPLGTYFGRGPEVRVRLLAVPGGRVIARGVLPAGYPDVGVRPTEAIDVGPVRSPQPFRVCLRNAGTRPVAVYGNGIAASRHTSATLDGKPLQADLALVFERGTGRSVASLLPAIAGRAALFRAGWVGPWTYVVLLVLVLGLVPLLLYRALAAARPE